MEKDNKKARDQAKSEHVNTVRSLVQYVKKQVCANEPLMRRDAYSECMARVGSSVRSGCEGGGA